MNGREQRLKKLVRFLDRILPEEPTLCFLDGIMYRDEPDDLIVGAECEGRSWERNKEETVEAFQERIKRDLLSTQWPRNDGNMGFSICLKRDHSHLPPTSEECPAYTPYPEVLRRVEVLKQNGQEPVWDHEAIYRLTGKWRIT